MSAAAIRTPRSIILAIVADEAVKAGIGSSDIFGPCRLARIVRARHGAMKRVHEALPDKSYPELGRIFGRNHASVMYALGAYRRKAKP
jgi:chromosomal replication initiation ATPase DnaA